MYAVDPSHFPVRHAVVVGAGIGGLATALRLRAAGAEVTVFDHHDWAGGKMRGVPSKAGLIDAGPTVLTLRHVFDALFAATGARLEDHVTLHREPLLARHFWPDGSTLDLFEDTDASANAVEEFAGKTARQEFLRFSRDANQLFNLFEAPMMRAGEPKIGALAKAALSAPRHLPVLSPIATLAGLLKRRFTDPRLQQLFGRYATYVGGSPFQSPALLSLIWSAEERGVWRVEGGMHQLAKACAARFLAMGGTLRLGRGVARINADTQGVTGVTLESGETVDADIVVFNGDPRALAMGKLGPAVTGIAPDTLTTPRSLSARVWSFAATPDTDLPLAHHNVFFAHVPNSEFHAISHGQMPQDPTLYVCAQSRGGRQPNGPERFEIILNAAPLTEGQPIESEVDTCRQLTFQTLARYGLHFDQIPPDDALTTPARFGTMFPASAGSLYGQTPHGMTAALKRPRARTQIPGLFLAGGGTHPGAGVPMAALSGEHAAAAIMEDLVST